MEITEYHPFKSFETKNKFHKMYNKKEREWPVDFENIVVDTSYGKTFVRISGPKEAPPLVLLHGMNVNSLMWIPNIKDLSKDYRTYAVDNIYDFGLSVYTKEMKKSKDFTDWLNELFDGLKLIDNINLMGMSYGGWIASQYALKSPERLNKLVLLAPAATVLPISKKFMIRGFMAMIPHPYFSKKLIYSVFEDSMKKDRKIGEKAAEEMLETSKFFKFKRMPNPTVLDDNELEKLKIPTLFLVGENEKIYSAKKAIKRLNTINSQIKTELIPAAGHDMLLAQTEMMNRKILEFLK